MKFGSILLLLVATVALAEAQTGRCTEPGIRMGGMRSRTTPSPICPRTPGQ